MKFGEPLSFSDAYGNGIKVDKNIAKTIFGKHLNNSFTFFATL